MGNDVTLRHLRAVVAVADCGSFTAAAAQLHVVQSSLSRTVAEAEKILSVRIFDRTSRLVAPTPEGRELVALARRLVTDVDAGIAHFTRNLAGLRGTVSVATLPSLAAVLLPPMARQFRTAFPGVRLRVEDSMSAEILRRVRDGSADLAVTVTEATSAPEHLVVTEIATDSFFCVMRPDHRLAGATQVAWADLEGEDFIHFGATSSISDHVDQVVRNTGLRLGDATQARNVGAVAGLAAAGLGISVVPALVLPMIGFAALRAVLMTAPSTRRSICVVHDPRRPLTSAAREFIEAVHTAGRAGHPLPAGASWQDPICCTSR